MNKYIAVLGRQPKISIAELEALYSGVRPIGRNLAEFESATRPDIRRLGGTLKIAEPIELKALLGNLPKEGKITIGVSDFSPRATAYQAQGEALRLKRKIAKSGRSVRVIPNKTAALSSATSLHNHLLTETKIELIKNGQNFYRVTGIQNIEEYAKRDQKRPARDAKVGMLPPKLAQILINLCGDLPEGTRLLDPFCGTGVVLQEAALMGYVPYGTDINERMVEYSQRNLKWLMEQERNYSLFEISQGDATSAQWHPPIGAVACETYLGQPMSLPPAEIKLKQEKQECGNIILKFLRNLAEQIEPGTPVVIAVPAWLRPNGIYERLNLLDEMKNLRYNVYSFKNLGQDDLLYHRDGQIVAREIIVLRKK